MAEGDSLSSTLAGLRENYYDYNISKHAEIWPRESRISDAQIAYTAKKFCDKNIIILATEYVKNDLKSSRIFYGL